jgi:hypothetical protein
MKFLFLQQPASRRLFHSPAIVSDAAPTPMSYIEQEDASG